MKFSKIVLLASSLFFVTPSFALLSPYYDSVRQITAIMEDKDIPETFRQEPIMDIEKKSGLKYRVKSEHCSLTVTLKAEGPKGGMVGAVSYKVGKISAMKCEFPEPNSAEGLSVNPDFDD